MSPRLDSLFFFASWALLMCSRVVEAVTTFTLFQYAPSGLFGINGTDRATCTPIKPLTNAISVYNAWGTGVNGAGTCNLTWTFVANANGPHTLVDSCSPTLTYTVIIVSTGTDAGGNSYAREMLWSTSNSRSYSYYSGCAVRHELAAFWTATSDSSTGGWISHFGWSTSHQRSPESYCTWDRITCNSASKIVAIDLSSNRLGNDPSLLFRAKIGATWMHLEKFIVANNAIKLSLDTANLTSMWPQLREFDVSNNQLYGVVPPSFGSAWNLHRLNLAGNAALQTSYAFGRAAWATDATLLTACNLGSLAFWSGWPAWIGKCNYKVPWQCLTPVTSISDASCVPYVASAPATLGLVVG